MVLIEIRNSEGIVGRCDAKCYAAETPGCTCICGGKNHGAGLNAALENTREMAEQWIQDYVELHDLQDWIAEVPARRPVQLQLPL